MRDDWSTLRKLMFQHMAAGGSLKEYEITGNPVAFNTNVAKPLSGFTVPFVPIQSGTGDPSPDNVRPIIGWQGLTAWRTGKNLLNPVVEKLIPFEDATFNRYSLNNGVITTTGNALAGFLISVKPSTRYTFSFTKQGNANLEVFAYADIPDKIRNGDRMIAYQNQNSVDSFTIPSDCNYIVCAFVSTISSNVISEFQLELGSTASTYAEYTGASYPVTFPATGKNLLNPSARTAAGNSVRYYRNTEEKLLLKAGQTYTLSATARSSQIAFFDLGNNVLASTYSQSLTYTPTDDVYAWIDAFIANGDIPEGGISSVYCQLEKGSSPTSYEPFDNTVYGGTLDAVNGVLTVEWKEIVKTWGDFANKTSLGDNTRGTLNISSYPSKPSSMAVDAKCNIAPRGTGWSEDSVHFYTNEGSCIVILPNDTDASTEIQVVYPLATPYEIPLDHITVQTLIGDNTIWTDTNGENTIKYKKKG